MIDALICQGKLVQYINECLPHDDECHVTASPPPHPKTNRPFVGVIHTIIGGCSRPLVEAESSSREIATVLAKWWKSDVIIFTDEDVRGIQIPHDDAMVTFLIIANHDVKRVLVDNEGSTDVLFYEAFQNMNLPM